MTTHATSRDQYLKMPAKSRAVTKNEAEGAKRLIATMKRRQKEVIRKTGFRDPFALASLLQKALADSENSYGLLVGLADYISMQLEGLDPQLKDWTPLAPDEDFVSWEKGEREEFFASLPG